MLHYLFQAKYFAWFVYLNWSLLPIQWTKPSYSVGKTEIHTTHFVQNSGYIGKDQMQITFKKGPFSVLVAYRGNYNLLTSICVCVTTIQKKLQHTLILLSPCWGRVNTKCSWKAKCVSRGWVLGRKQAASNDPWAQNTLTAMSHNMASVQFSILVCLNKESGTILQNRNSFTQNFFTLYILSFCLEN